MKDVSIRAFRLFHSVRYLGVIKRPWWGRISYNSPLLCAPFTERREGRVCRDHL